MIGMQPDDMSNLVKGFVPLASVPSVPAHQRVLLCCHCLQPACKPHTLAVCTSTDAAHTTLITYSEA